MRMDNIIRIKWIQLDLEAADVVVVLPICQHHQPREVYGI